MRLLCAGSFAFFLSFYLLLSVLPLYAREAGVPDRAIGAVIGCFAFASMLAKPWAGWASDRFGRRPVMLGGALLFLASSLAYGWSSTAVLLIGVRLLHGLGMGLYPTATAAVVADLAPPERRGELLGLLGAFANVAMAIGPIAGAAIAYQLGFGALFGISAGIALAAVVLTSLTRETVARQAPSRFRLGGTLSTEALVPSVILLLMMLTYGLQVSFLPIYADRHGMNPGLFFLVFALVMALVRRPAGQWSDRSGRAPVATAGLVVAALALGVLALRQDLAGLALAGALYGAGFGTAQPALMAWCVDVVDARHRGRAMGTYYTAFELGIAAGAMSSGLAVSAFGFPATFLGAAAAALLAATLSMLARASQPG